MRIFTLDPVIIASAVGAEHGPHACDFLSRVTSEGSAQLIILTDCETELDWRILGADSAGAASELKT